MRLAAGTGQYAGGLRIRLLSNVSIAAGATSIVKVAGVGGIPATGISSVAVNFTVNGTGGSGALTAYPSELTAAPGVTGTRYRSGVFEDHLLIVKVGTDGQIKVKNTGTVAAAVYADVHGYFTAEGTATGSNYVPLDTARIIGNQTVAANSTATFAAMGVGGIPSSNVGQVVFSLVVKSEGSGRAMVFPSGGTAPSSTNITYRPPTFVSNLVIVPPGSDGKISIKNVGSSPLTVYADITGYFAAPTAAVSASTQTPVTPTRIVNSATVAAGATYAVAPRGKAGVPGTGVGAVGINLTAKSTAGGLLRVYPTGQTNVPNGGSIAFQANDDWANFIPIKLGVDGTFTIKNTGTTAITLSVDTFTYFTISVAPGPPTGVTATAGDASATVTWQKPASDGGAPITRYTVTANPGGAKSNVDGSTLQATFATLTNGTAYTFTVTAANIVGTSAPSSASAPITPKPAPVKPTPPTDVTAEPDDARATVKWQKSAEGSSPITGYTVTSSPGGKMVSVAGSQTQATVSGLNNGTTYTFTVTATNSAGTSAASKPSVAVKVGRVAGAPTQVVANAADGSVSVTWAAPTDSGTSPVTSYTVTEPTISKSVTVAGTTALFADLPNGRTYTFWVKATNDIGDSAWSNLSNAVTPQSLPVPGRPLITSAEPRDGEVALAWAPPQTGGAAVAKYRITVQPGARILEIAGEVSATTVRDLDNGTSYTFTIVAINGIGQGTFSIPVQATPRAGQVPLQPTVVRTVTGDGRIDIHWLTARDGGASILAYKLAAEPDGPQVDVPANATTASLTGLANGKSYNIQLTAINRVGTSQATRVANLVPKERQAPSAPFDLETTATADGQVEVSWHPPADPGASPINEYRITVNPGGKTVTEQGCGVQQERCRTTVTGLDPATEYTFNISANNSDGTGPASETSAPIRAIFRSKADAWQLTPMAAETLVSSEDDGTLIFNAPPAEVTQLASGRIVIIPPTKAAPEGMIRRVVRISNLGTRVTIATVPGHLTDLITDGDFSGQVTLGAADLVSPQRQTGKQQRRGDGEIPAGPPLHFPLHQSIGKSGRIDADLTIAPKLVYNLKIRSGTISGRVALQGRLTGHVRAHAARQENWSKEFGLGKQKFLTTVKAGRNRIPIVVTHILKATVHADASGAVTLSGRPDITTGVEANLSGPKGTTGPLFEDNTVADRPELDGSASIRLGLTGAEFVSVAGTLGIGAQVNPYLMAKADTSATPWWFVRAGADIRACVSWFDECTPASLSKDFYVTLKSADGPFRGISITPDHISTGRGKSVDFNVTVHNAADGPVRWEVIEGPGSIDQTGLYVASAGGRAVIRATREDSSNVDDPTAEATVEVDPYVPNAPVDIKAAGGPLSANVSWQPPKDTLVGITQYAVVATPLDQEARAVTGYTSPSERGLLIPELVPGIAYSIQVYAATERAVSSPSQAVTVTPTKGLNPQGDARLLTVDANGNIDSERDSTTYYPKISGDGRYAFFAVKASSNLIPAEARKIGSSSLYLVRKDIDTGEIKLVSRRADGRTPAPIVPRFNYAITGDGERAAYITMPEGGSSSPSGRDPATDAIVIDIDQGDTWTVYDGTTDWTPTEIGNISGDGDIVLLQIEGLDANTNDCCQLIRAERNGSSKIVDRRYYSEDESSDSTFLGFSDMSSDGNTVVYDYTTWLQKSRAYMHEIKIYYHSIQKTEISYRVIKNNQTPYSNFHWPHISADGTTLTYSAQAPENGPFTAFTKKVTAAGVPGVPVGGGNGVFDARSLSANGRFITAWRYDGTNGIFDSVAGTTMESNFGTIASLTYDGGAALVETRCSGFCNTGVWYQAYNLPGLRGNLQGCNVPDYGYIGQYGRRTGMRVKLCFPMPEGTPASAHVKPPGWPAKNEYIPGTKEWRWARGHLLGNQLGGSGSDARNLVTMFQLANRELMDPEEDKVANTVKDGEDLYYYVAPVYTDIPSQGEEQDLAKRMPDKIHIVASGEKGFFLDACIPNVEGGIVTYDDPCTA
ncbi:fibronectin type III domain-containing protein [Actinomadura hibisca]|uniref:fibronectin type III domain-containing protein n=1 Tax=Actinomadura hibisca TaxID=68565 RepID=UPI001471E15D|nr:fibronectin type III domain-containing protein [Actinomadura hibisca]